MTDYLPPTRAPWVGRQTDPSLGAEYWYQKMELLDLRQEISADPPHLALLGYACEEGVRRNQGRLGAAAGASEARRSIASLANHLGPLRIADAGDITCLAGDLEGTQESFGRAIARLLAAGIFPIGIGGGHDIAWAHYLGIRAALAGRPGTRLGVINFDAHFDLRSFADGPTSGTPFNQILVDGAGQHGYLAIGIQRAANPPSLFQTAERLGAEFIPLEACGPNAQDVAAAITQVQHFAAAYDHLYLSIDIDGFPAAMAPGVSAPSPVGLEASFFFPVLAAVLGTGKVISCDLAEYNPTFDRDGITGRLVSRVVERIALGK